jgi:N-acetyl-gamma-glutamyl-phosphate reductase
MKFSLAFFLLGASQTSGFAFQQSTRSAPSTSLLAKYKIFIDGEAGTTGLQVRGRIEARDDLEIISPPSDLRKDEETRKKFINEADCVILCKSRYIYFWSSNSHFRI